VFSLRDRNGIGPNFTDAIKGSPIVEAYDSLGHYIYQPNFANPRKSPLARLDDRQNERSTRFFTTFYGEIEPVRDLTLRSNFNLDLGSGRLGFMYPQKVPNEGMTVSGVDITDNLGYLWNNILNYRKQINQHRLNLTLVHEVQYDRNEFYGIDGQEQEFDRSLWYNLSTNLNQTTESSLRETALVSFLGRINYTLADKYIVSLSGRYDGASQLSPGNKWDFFPSASVAWRLIDEPFLAGNKIFSDLKLRAGFGATGNASISPYSTAASLNSSPLYYQFGEPGAETPAFGFRPIALASEGLKWERTQQVNAGLDFGLFNNRLSGSFDVFSAQTDRLLLQDQLPPTAGFDNIYVNAGKTKSWGWELYLQAFTMNTEKFKWNTVLSFSSSREEIVELTSGLTEDEGNLWFVGYPISVIYDFNKIGIWQIGQEEEPTFTAPGEIRVEDVDGNGVIDFEDRKVLGTPRPKWSGSLINTFNAFGFDLSVNVFAKMGQLIRANSYDFDPRMYDNQLAIDYWTPVNPTNDWPRLDAARAELPYESTLSIRDGSYIKVKNITVGYQLPGNVLGKTPVSSVRLYASARNPFILYSNLYEGIDPERNGSTSWPLARLWLFGLDISF
ncbi:MAG: SusC/RagA family TonB-linked outer membrane protein, partial [Saprospiraceae bacterium]|nr:SusC/RagA family TonB-linked outer membrane protein [Saprospiraceae bacterium]